MGLRQNDAFISTLRGRSYARARRRTQLPEALSIAIKDPELNSRTAAKRLAESRRQHDRLAEAPLRRTVDDGTERQADEDSASE